MFEILIAELTNFSDIFFAMVLYFIVKLLLVV